MRNREIATLTRAQLTKEIAERADVSQKDAEHIQEVIFDSIARALRKGDHVELRGFGSFRTRQRSPRMGHNPKTLVPVSVPAKTIPYFRASRELLALVAASAPPPITVSESE